MWVLSFQTKNNFLAKYSLARLHKKETHKERTVFALHLAVPSCFTAQKKYFGTFLDFSDFFSAYASFMLKIVKIALRNSARKMPKTVCMDVTHRHFFSKVVSVVICKQ